MAGYVIIWEDGEEPRSSQERKRELPPFKPYDTIADMPKPFRDTIRAVQDRLTPAEISRTFEIPVDWVEAILRGEDLDR